MQRKQATGDQLPPAVRSNKSGNKGSKQNVVLVYQWVCEYVRSHKGASVGRASDVSMDGSVLAVAFDAHPTLVSFVPNLVPAF